PEHVPLPSPDPNAQGTRRTMDPSIVTDEGSFWNPITYMVFLPLVGALAMLLVPKANEVAHKAIALVSSLGAAAVGIYILTQFDYDNAGALQWKADIPWIEVINSRWIVGIDGISLPLSALTLLIVPLCVVYSWNHLPSPGNPKAFFTLMLILEVGM